MVSSADQPDRVPPATSTRSIPAGTGTPYQRFWRLEGGPPPLPLGSTSRRVLGLPGEAAERSWSARNRSTRCRSASILPRSTRSPCQIA